MARQVDENFEGTGYEESWSETAGSGNTVDEDVSIPGTPPNGSGSQCLNCILDGTNANAYAERDALGSAQTVNYIRAYIYVGSGDTGDTTGVSIIRMFGTADSLEVIYRYTGALGHHLRLYHYDGGPSFDGIYGINLGQWYRYEGFYNSDTEGWEHRIDGSTIFSGTGSALRVDSDTISVGPSGGRTGAMNIHFDLVAWDDSDWVGEESAAAGGLRAGSLALMGVGI